MNYRTRRLICIMIAVWLPSIVFCLAMAIAEG